MAFSQILIGFFTGGALVEGEGSAEAVGACPGLVRVEAVSSPPSSDSDSVSVRSKGHLMIGAASRKLKGSTSVPLPKKVTNRVKSSLVSDPARAMVRNCKASFLSAAAFPSSSAASRKRRRD